jgi:hypothetical protein
MVTLFAPKFPDKSVSKSSVTVTLFVNKGNGLVCTFASFVKDVQWTVLACTSNITASEIDRKRLRQAFPDDAACAQLQSCPAAATKAVQPIRRFDVNPDLRLKIMASANRINESIARRTSEKNKMQTPS